MIDLENNELVEQAYKILEQAYNENLENSFSVFSVVAAKDYRDKSKSGCHTMILGSTKQLLLAFHNIFKTRQERSQIYS